MFAAGAGDVIDVVVIDEVDRVIRDLAAGGVAEGGGPAARRSPCLRVPIDDRLYASRVMLYGRSKTFCEWRTLTVTIASWCAETRRSSSSSNMRGSDWRGCVSQLASCTSTSAAAGKGSEMLRAAPGQLGRPSPADSCRSSASAGAGATVRRRFIAVLFFGG